MTARISVVIPTYQMAGYVGEAIESVLRQSYAAHEIVVVDDGSTDDTLQVLDRFAELIRIIRQPNAGVSLARNRGAAEASGEWIAFLDADDTWLPRKLEIQIDRLVARASVVASFTEATVVDEVNDTTRELRYRNELDMTSTLLLHGCVIGNNSSVVVRRSMLLGLGGYDTQLSQSADWDLWLRLAQRGSFDLVKEPLVRYRVHGSSMSRDIGLLEADTRRVLDKFFSSAHRVGKYAKLRRSAYAHNYAVLAGSYLHAGQLGSSLRCLGRSALYHPGALRHALGAPMRAARRSIAAGERPQ